MELTPAGLAFAILVLLAMFLGVSAAIWHSWLAPYLLRHRLAVARNDSEKAIVSSAATADAKTGATDQTPDLDFKDVATPNNSPTVYEPGAIRSCLPDDDTLDASLSKMEKSDDGGELVKPKPVYYTDRRMRFSANAPERDLSWWFI